MQHRIRQQDGWLHKGGLQQEVPFSLVLMTASCSGVIQHGSGVPVLGGHAILSNMPYFTGSTLSLWGIVVCLYSPPSFERARRRGSQLVLLPMSLQEVQELQEVSLEEIVSTAGLLVQGT